MKPPFKVKSNFFDRLNSGIGGLIPAKSNAFGRALRANKGLGADRPEKIHTAEPKPKKVKPRTKDTDTSHLLSLAYSGDEKRLKEVIDGQAKVDAPRRRRTVREAKAKAEGEGKKPRSGSRKDRAKEVRKAADGKVVSRRKKTSGTPKAV